ncbi:MAG: transglycosylase domain-containing protein [Actinomycetota bacterium]
MVGRIGKYRGVVVRVLTWWVRLGVIVVAGALIASAMVVGVTPRLWGILNAHDEGAITLPDWESIAQRSYVYDTSGNEIAVYELENSQPVDLASVPRPVIDAILAVEDREFYNHHGVNVRGLFRATLSNFEGGARQGASTITQQVVKMEYLAGLERDGRYKILQIVDALRLEKQKTKDQILERYLNTVFFGNNTYGIQAAAEVYFGKRVGDLTLEDGAFLAGLIQAPSTYDPIRHPQQSQRRFEQALGALVDVGLLDEAREKSILACLAATPTLDCTNAWKLPDALERNLKEALGALVDVGPLDDEGMKSILVCFRVRTTPGFDCPTPWTLPEVVKESLEEVLGSLVADKALDEGKKNSILACLVAMPTPRPDCVPWWKFPDEVEQIAEEGIVRTHFSEEVKAYLLNKSTLLGDTYAERYNKLFRGGLRVYTTIDPAVQAAAESARATQLPVNSAGIDTAIVTLDSKTGAVRAMVGGKPFVPERNEVNMALAPRQTGSSIKMFILAAAVSAGAQNDDLIDGTLPCILPNPDDPENPFIATEGVSRPVGTLAEMTWASINCAFSRLAQIVGLDRVVDTTYRMASNLYLYPERSPEERTPLRPYASFATGANEMSPLDMASGAQTLANGGLHMQPYYIERIDGPDGVIYQHSDPGVQVLTSDAAARTVSILEGVMTNGTARRKALEGRVSAGKTGTQDNNTNAWMVGFTPELTTAVWVGHPDLYLSMVKIPEFVDAGVDKVIGGTFPASIWKATMDEALAGRPATSFPTPPANPRVPMRLYLPGVDCPASTTTSTTVAPTTATTTPGDPTVSSTTSTTSTTTSTTSTTSTTAVPIPGVITDINTTIPRGQVDPTWPVPTLPIDEYSFPACA